MKSSLIGIKSIFMVVLVITFLIPINVFAESPFYLALKSGIYSPQSSDLDGNNGFSGEIAFGFQFNPYIAAEFGIGYFNTEREEMVVGATYMRRKEFDINVLPVTFTLKAILPYKKWEFFWLGGGGVYIVSGPFEVEDHGYHYYYHYDYHYYYDYHYDYDAVFGGYLGAGIHYNITPTIFVGAEGKYLWTGKVKGDEVFDISSEARFKLDGVIATAVFGVRF
jgi:opacity protein-like surface antigen